MQFGRYPGSLAQSGNNSLGDEEYTSHFARPLRAGHRYSTSDLTTHRGFGQWACRYPCFPDKRIWYAEHDFNTGLYGFHFEPYFRELVRLIYRKRLSFDRLFLPLHGLLKQLES